MDSGGGHLSQIEEAGPMELPVLLFFENLLSYFSIFSLFFFLVQDSVQRDGFFGSFLPFCPSAPVLSIPPTYYSALFLLSPATCHYRDPFQLSAVPTQGTSSRHCKGKSFGEVA